MDGGRYVMVGLAYIKVYYVAGDKWRNNPNQILWKAKL